MRGRDFKVTSRSFAIPITMEEMDNIEHKERTWDIDDVGQMIEMLDGVSDVEFNGHFGLYIYLTIDKEFDNDKTLYAISEIINREGKLNPDMDGYR